MEQARCRAWVGQVAVSEVDELDWSPDPDAADGEPLPLVRRRAAPRARTLAGVGGPVTRRAASSDADDLTW